MGLKILVVSTEFPPGPGGIGTHAYSIARELYRHGCEIMVLTPQDYAKEYEIQKFNEEIPFPVIRLVHKPGIALEAISRGKAFLELVSKWHPEVILASGTRSVWMVAGLEKFHRIPWVAVGHGTEFGSRNSIEGKISRVAYSRANGIICVSEFTRSVMQWMGVTSECVQVIYNGADDDHFYPSKVDQREPFCEKIGIPPDSKILLTVGNLTKRKGQEMVIRALPVVLEQIPEVEYLMAGLPTDKPFLENLARELGVITHTHFLGVQPKEDLLRLYQNCDILLMTSRRLPNGDFEGFGISVIEAALCGKPAIVSAGSGLEEAVVHGQTGVCVPEDNPMATAQAIIELLHNAEQRLTMGMNARIRAQREFTWKVAGKKYLEFLTKVLERQR